MNEDLILYGSHTFQDNVANTSKQASSLPMTVTPRSSPPANKIGSP